MSEGEGYAIVHDVRVGWLGDEVVVVVVVGGIVVWIEGWLLSDI